MVIMAPTMDQGSQPSDSGDLQPVRIESHPTSSDASVAQQPSRRFAVGTGLGILATLIIGGCTFFLMFRDTTPELTDAALEAAVERWEADGPTSYNMDLVIGGARPGEVHVEVRDGQVTVFTRDDQIPKRRHAWDAWTVPGQFDTIDREQELAADPSGEMGVPPGTRLLLRAEFHPRWGYPVRYRRLVLGSGPVVTWEITKFEAVR